MTRSRILRVLAAHHLLFLAGLLIVVFHPQTDDTVRTVQWSTFWGVGIGGAVALGLSGGFGRVASGALGPPLAAVAVIWPALAFTAFRPFTSVVDGLNMVAGVSVAAMVCALFTPSGLARLLAFVAFGGLLEAGWAFMQYLGKEPFGLRWAIDYGGGRPFATLGNPNFLGGHFAVLTPVALVMLLASRGPAGRLVWFAVTAFWAWALFVAQTRGSWLAATLGVAVALAAVWRSRPGWLLDARRWLAALAIMGAVAGGYAVAGNPHLAFRLVNFGDFGQFAKRYTAMKGALLVWRDAPVLGIGPGCFKHGFGRTMARAMPARERHQFIHTFSEERTHCDPLQMVSETGVVGAGVFVWLVVTAARSAMAVGRAVPPLPYALLGGGVGLFVQSLTNFPMHIAPTALLFWLAVGAAAAGAGAGGTPARPRGAAIPAWALLALVPWALAISQLLASAYNRKGRDDLLRQRWANSHAWYEKAIRINWDNRREEFYAASTLFQLGRYGEAVELFKREIANNPYFMDGHSNLGSTLGIMGRVEEAEAMMRRALELNPAYAEAYANLGVALISQARYEEAERVFRFALSLEPGLKLAENGLAQVRAGRGQSPSLPGL